MPDNPEVTTAELLSRMQEGWESLQAYIKTLSPQQLTEPTDAAGWTVKDHLIHLAVWENGVDAALSRDNRAARMGLTPEQWASDDYDIMNAVIQQAHKDMTPPRCCKRWRTCISASSPKSRRSPMPT